MFAEFGDVYGMIFEQWWDRRGVRLLSEQLALPAVRRLNPHDPQFSRDFDRHLLLEIPSI